MSASVPVRAYTVGNRVAIPRWGKGTVIHAAQGEFSGEYTVRTDKDGMCHLTRATEMVPLDTLI